MGVIRSIVGILLVIVLVLNLFAANVVIATDRTALNGEFVKSTLQEEEAYAAMQSIAVEEAEARVSEFEQNVDVPVDPGAVVHDTLTKAYLRNQTEANVERVYGYLNGNREEFKVIVDLSPVKENLATVVENRIENRTVSEMIDLVTAQEGDLSVTVSNVTVDLGVVGDMAKNRSEYREARRAIREQVRQRIEEEFPRASDEQTARLVNRTLEQFGQQAKEQVETVVENAVSDRYQPVASSLADMAKLGVEGLTADMRYATFEERVTAEKADLAENASDVVQNVLDEEFQDQYALHEELSPSAMENIERARRAVGIVNVLVYALPILALVLFGLLYLLTRSFSWTAIGAGTGLTLVGGVGFLGASRVPAIVKSRAPTGDLPEEAVDVAFGIIDQVAGVFGAQSLALLALGVVCLGAGIALRFLGGDEGGENGGVVEGNEPVVTDQ